MLSWLSNLLGGSAEPRCEPKGYALCVGLNEVDSAHYDGWKGQLMACEADAIDMTALLKREGFRVTTLLTQRGTRTSVIGALKGLAEVARAGDLVVYTYSGHGGQLPDSSGDETDGIDETQCLFDGQMSDDELSRVLATFRTGVRVLVISDSCHSGTVTRLVPGYHVLLPKGATVIPPQIPEDRVKCMPRDVAIDTYRMHKVEYDARASTEPLPVIRASVLSVSGCQDNQYSMDGLANGAFTAALLRAWNVGKFTGDYRAFHRAIQRQLPATQSPNLDTTNTKGAFLSECPFTI